MRKIIYTLLGVFICSLFSVSEVAAAPRENTLKIYNWADYIDELLIDEFVVWYKEQTGEDVTIVYQTYDLNEVALAKIERARADYDLICPSEYIIERMINKGLLLPIDKNFGETPNYLGNISPYIKERFSVISPSGKDINDYAAPYTWNTTGLLYNTRTVTREEALSWSVLWDKKFKNRVLMKDDSRQIYGIARAYLNQDKIAAGVAMSDIANDNSGEAMAQVEQELISLRDNIAGFEMDFGKEMMVKEKADISIQYLGDALWAYEEGVTMGVDLDFVVPMEGSVMFIDAWVIPKYSENVKAASYFINFMNRPDNALRNMNATGYLSTIASANILESLEDESLDATLDLSYFFGEGAEAVKCSPMRFSSYEEASRCAMMRDFGDNTEKLLVMWATVKGDNLSISIVIIILLTILLFVIIYTRKIYCKRAARRRYEEFIKG